MSEAVDIRTPPVPHMLPFEGGEPDFERPPAHPARIIIYIGIALVLLMSAPFLRGVGWRGGDALHTQMETISTILALVIGVLSLVRYYGQKELTYLYIGTGFLATVLLDGAHTLLTSPLTGRSELELAEVAASSWLVSRVFLSLFLFGSWAVWYQEQKNGATRRIKDDSVFWTTGTLVLLALVILILLALSPVSRVTPPGTLIPNPSELVPGVLFLLALAGYLRKGRWRIETFEHWLVISLVLSVVLHAGYLAFSTGLHDSLSGWGHILKIGSYGAILTGLAGSVTAAFREQNRAAREIARANLALAQEIKVRSDTERVLYESEQGLRDFLENASDLVQSTDSDGRILYVNKAWKAALGYSDEPMEGRDSFSHLQPRFQTRWRECHKRVFAGESVAGLKLAFVTAQGEELICTGSSSCRRKDGEPVAMLTMLRNVTEELRAEQELAESQANLKALFESTGDPIWSVGIDHSLITFNAAFALTVEAVSGHEPVPGDAPETLVAKADVQWFRERYARAIAGNRFSAERTEVLAEEVRSYELFFNPIFTLNGVWGVVVFSKDVTPKKLVEEALRLAKEEAEQGNQAKSQFLANMSHELRTPLNSVIGFANILLKDKQEKLEKAEKGYLERILANGKHLLTLINEILDLSKIEAGKMEVELQSVDLDSLIRGTIQQMEGHLRGKPVVLGLSAPERMEEIMTDSGKLKQVLINLVGNALKFTDEGEVTVRVQADPESGVPGRISVTDSGAGIPEDRLNAIFEAFQQADGSTTRRFGGTGLGLTISRSICHLLGYDITAESVPEKGSTFTIHLNPDREEPREEAGAEETPSTAEEPLPLPAGSGTLQEPLEAKGKARAKSRAVNTRLHSQPRKTAAPSLPEAALAERNGARLEQFLGVRTVLVIDDEHDSRLLLGLYLEEAGCRVVMARDGEEGLEVARAQRPDVITLDLLMPGMSGWMFLDELRVDPDLRDIPVVVVSTIAKDGGSHFLGAVELLTKPVDKDALLAALSRNLLHAPAKILVVEDDVEAWTIVEQYLSDSGMIVERAADGQEALESLGAFAPDLIVLDLMMPVMDGMTFLNRLRSMPRHIDLPVVVLSAKSLSKEEARDLRLKASGVIAKGAGVQERLKEALDRIFSA